MLAEGLEGSQDVQTNDCGYNKIAEWLQLVKKGEILGEKIPH